MKYLLTTVLLFFSLQSLPCGSDWSEEYFFYNLFNQEHISETSYHPFLRYSSGFYSSSKSLDQDKENFRLWQKVLKKWSVEEIQTGLETNSDEEFEKLWSGKSKGEEAKAYMVFARKCSKAFAYRGMNSWSYNQLREKQKPNLDLLIEEGMLAFESEKNKQIHQRYAYQLIRLWHYSERYKTAINFYNGQNLTDLEKTEIYYYTLDQLAGCYYSSGNYEKAAYLFMTVFSNSYDRKESAYLSYSFCNHHSALGKPHLQNLDDTLSFITLKSIREFSNPFVGMKQIIKAAPNDSRLELLFMRSINEMEREVWPIRFGMEGKDLPNLVEANYALDNLLELCGEMVQNRKVKNKDFWALSYSYLTFIKGDTPKAMKYLKKAKDKKYKVQKSTLQQLYTVFSWNEMNTDNERIFANYLGEIGDLKKSGNSTVRTTHSVLLDRIAHLYYKDEKLAQAFLIHNDLHTMIDLASLELIDDLIHFLGKTNKSAYETILAQRAANDQGLDYMYYLKGMYYLQHAQPKLANDFLKASSYYKKTSKQKRKIESIVSAKIFSNNTKECFNCNERYLMQDKVYSNTAFTFIKDKFSKGELSVYLLKLESLSKDSDKEVRSQANYLLGNYYFNISNTGYYRGILSGHTNTGWKTYFKNDNYKGHNPTAVDLIKSKKGYNFNEVTYYYKLHFGLADVALGYYQKSIDESYNEELKARSLYMMSKCELNQFYNSRESHRYGYTDYIGYVGRRMGPSQESFKTLKEDYNHTSFYRQIIRECSYFRNYCRQ